MPASSWSRVTCVWVTPTLNTSPGEIPNPVSQDEQFPPWWKNQSALEARLVVVESCVPGQVMSVSLTLPSFLPPDGQRQVIHFSPDVVGQPPGSCPSPPAGGSSASSVWPPEPVSPSSIPNWVSAPRL